MGRCEAHLDVRSVPALSRLSGRVAGGERSDTRGAHRGYRGDRRLHQCSDREILGRLVEHAASAGKRFPDGWTDHPSEPARAARRDGRGLRDVVPDAVARGDESGNPREADSPDADRRSGQGLSSMDVAAAHVGFVFAAYALSAAVLGGLAIRTVITLKVLERKLEALEARQAPRRKAAT